MKQEKMEIISGLAFKMKIDAIIRTRKAIKSLRHDDRSWQQIEREKAILASFRRKIG